MSSFTIDVSELAKPSKKPKFLSMRFRSHSSAFGQNVDQKRNELLQQKKQKLQHHHAKIHQKKPVVGMSLDRLQSELDKAAERREQLLDRKKQGWGNIVKRAKVIAKIQKRQSLMDRLMKQKRIDEKLRKSDLRRKGLVVREDEAASKIQQWYRQTKFKPLVRIYTKIGMNRQKTKELGFEVAVKKVTNPTLVKLANFIVLRSRKMTGEKRKLNSPGKMLLSAFLICCYPIETVGEMNELVNLASRLVHQVETWLHPALDTELIVPLGTLFFNTFIEFNNAFEAWKNKDASGLVDEIVGRVCDLDRLWVKVMDQIDATDQWAPSIDKQFQDHLKRIVKMAGMSGVSKMMSARGIVMKEMEMNSKVKLDQSPTIVYPVQEPQDSVAEEMDVDAAPDEETLKQFGGILSNEYLAHELVMDPEFKLQKPKVDPNVERISIIARKAFTDKLRTEIEQKNYMHSVLGIVLEMKQVI
jgi:hypothetical protein